MAANWASPCPSLSAGIRADATRQDEIAIQNILDKYNKSQNDPRLFVGTIARLSPNTRCWAGHAADFPGQALLTIIQPSGQWVQVDIDPVTGPDRSLLLSGDDYRLAGIDPQAFDATGYQCEVEHDGTVYLIDLLGEQKPPKNSEKVLLRSMAQGVNRVSSEKQRDRGLRVSDAATQSRRTLRSGSAGGHRG